MNIKEMTWSEIREFLDEVDTDDLIDELDMRGYYIEDENGDATLSEAGDDELMTELYKRGYKTDMDIDSVIWNWNNYSKQEALILLEREYPELVGISKVAV